MQSAIQSPQTNRVNLDNYRLPGKTCNHKTLSSSTIEILSLLASLDKL